MLITTMRCKKCGQVKRFPSKKSRDVQLCGDCLERQMNKKENQVDDIEAPVKNRRLKFSKRNLINQLPDENNLDIILDRGKSEPKEDKISGIDKLKADEADRIKRFEKKLEKSSTKEEFQSSIESLCWDIITQHKSEIRTADHNIELMDDMIELYKQVGSLKEISKTIGKSFDTLREGFKNPIRLPQELRELLNNGKLSSDPIMASAIAFYVTDWFQWDSEKEKESTVVNTCKEVAKMMKENLEMRREFFTTKEDYSKPVSHSSEQKNEIQEIFTDFTIKFPDSWQWGDRTGKQYNRIIYSKNVKAIRFLKRWEFENKRRIPKSWAFQMIDELITHNNINRFLQEHEDEFQD